MKLKSITGSDDWCHITCGNNIAAILAHGLIQGETDRPISAAPTGVGVYLFAGIHNAQDMYDYLQLDCEAYAIALVRCSINDLLMDEDALFVDDIYVKFDDLYDIMPVAVVTRYREFFGDRDIPAIDDKSVAEFKIALINEHEIHPNPKFMVRCGYSSVLTARSPHPIMPYALCDENGRPITSEDDL